MAVLALLPVRAYADDPIVAIKAATAKLKTQPQSLAANAGAAPRCAGKGPTGRKYLHVTFYAASNFPFVDARAADAAAAFIRYNVELSRRGGPGGWTPTRGPSSEILARAAATRRASPSTSKIDAPDDACARS